MFLQRSLTQRISLALGQTNRMAILAAAQRRTYYKDNVLMPREQGEYYADPLNVAERVVRMIGLHDACTDAAKVSLS
jgi:hypothetical protein